MKCTNHPEVEAAGMCVYCGKPFCKECLIEVKGKFYCKNDIANVIEDAKNSNANNPVINITNSNDSVNTNANTSNNLNGIGGFILSPRSRTIALILCILSFFGFGGLHRFYVGKTATGVLHICTVGLFFVGTVIDLMAILNGTFTDKYGFVLR